MLTMMNDVDIKLVGDNELLSVLKELDYKTQQRVLKRVVSDAANIYVKAIKAVIPVRRTTRVASGEKWHPPGTGKKSPYKKMGKSKSVATVFVGPRTRTGDYSTDAWYLRFWEYGTKHSPPHMRIQATYAANKERVESNMMNSIRTIITKIWNKQR
jgi:HK97 gp10 family phage protein